VINPSRSLADLAAKLNRLLDSVENQTSVFRECLTNFATDSNLRADRIAERLDNQATDGNLRLDRIADELGRLGQQLERLYESGENRSRDANARLDRLIGSVERQIGQDLISLIDLGSKRAHEINLRFDGLSAAMNAQARAGRVLLERLTGSNSETEKGNVAAATAPARKQTNGGREPLATNDLAFHQRALNRLSPWKGEVPSGFLVDFLGILTDANFRAQYGIDPSKTGGAYLETKIPPLDGANGEWWFETVDWLAAAQDARDYFVMVTLGACYGAQAVGAYRALQLINPMPCKLVAVEPEAENFEWLKRHLRDNGIDPSEHWLIPMAISDSNSPVLFPIGAAGSGANNSFATNDLGERRGFIDRVIAAGKAPEVLSDIVLNNSIGGKTNALLGQNSPGEMKIVSAVTIKDVVDPFTVVDFLEADIQQSEILVFPPFLDLLRAKVRRIHIGTHGAYNHQTLSAMFKDAGWDIVFDYGPEAKHRTPIGTFETCDGILTVRNPDL